MQTFLPYENFSQSAECLDYRRLGKQRVEAKQIYNIVSGQRTTGGWINHPAVVMWRGYSDLLALYHNRMIAEWIKRGYNNTMPYLPIRSERLLPQPSWLGDDKFHKSHQSNLLRKDDLYYGAYHWDVDATLPYVWPIEQKGN
jgi:hypothetical protein